MQMIRSDVDIFCLQEVWDVRIQRKIRTALRDAYPYVLSAIDLDSESDSDEPACNPDLLDAFLTCRSQRCPGPVGLRVSVCGILRLKCHHLLHGDYGGEGAVQLNLCLLCGKRASDAPFILLSGSTVEWKMKGTLYS